MQKISHVLVSTVVATGLMIPLGFMSAVQGQATTVECGAVTNQRDINNCFAGKAKRMQNLLDTLLQQLKNSNTPESSRQLQRVQNEWISYRNDHCKWQSNLFKGGSISSTIYSNCISSLSRQRIDELKINLCEGHGMTGYCDASKRYD